MKNTRYTMVYYKTYTSPDIEKFHRYNIFQGMCITVASIYKVLFHQTTAFTVNQNNSIYTLFSTIQIKKTDLVGFRISFKLGRKCFKKRGQRINLYLLEKIDRMLAL